MSDMLSPDRQSIATNVIGRLLVKRLIKQFAPERKFHAYILTRIPKVVASISFYTGWMVPFGVSVVGRRS